MASSAVLEQVHYAPKVMQAERYFYIIGMDKQIRANS